MLSRQDKAYIGHINGRWEALIYIDGDKVTFAHRYTRQALVVHMRKRGFRCIDISKA